MEEYLNKLKEKFNYSEELMTMLTQLIPSMVTYYGKEYEGVILSALSNCEIHFQAKDENPSEYLNHYFGVEKEWKMPELGGAFYQNEIMVKENRIVAKPIIYLKTVYYNQYMPFDFQNDKNLNTLVHEICHLVKGYGKVKMVDGKIIDSTGLMKDIYTYFPNGIEEKGNERVGIEEAINEVDAMRIMEIMTGREQEIGGYKRAGTMATWLLEHEDIARVIKSSEFQGDEDWIQYLGEDIAQMLIENFDILVKSMYVSFSEINTPEKRAALHQKMDMAEDKIYEFAKEYGRNQAL